MKKNIVIIGSGLGGLTAGALLAKNGHKVTLLEQHYLLGGCATTYKRPGGFNCEVGLHQMDGLHQGDDKDKIFQFLDVYEHVEFVKTPEFYRLKTDTIDFTLPSGFEASKEALKTAFPNEIIGIDKLYNEYTTITNALETLSNMKWYKLPQAIIALFPFIKAVKKSASDFIDTTFKDQKLKDILYANLGYYHDNPNELSYLYFMVAQSSYLNSGGWFIKGGSGRLSEYLASVITVNGGEVISSAEVTDITLQEKTATAVTYIKQKKEHTLSCDFVIANTSPHQVYGSLIKDQSYYDHSIDNKQTGISIVSIYIGFNKNLKSIYGTKPYSLMLSHNGTELGFVDYSQIDSGLTPEDKSFGAIAINGYINEWNSLSEDEYKAKKESVLNSCLDALESEYPNIKNYIEFAEVATPKTIQHYIKTETGTAYGFAPTPQNMMQRFPAKSRTVENLRFVGAWAFGGGFSPAIVSGYQGIKDMVKKL